MPMKGALSEPAIATLAKAIDEKKPSSVAPSNPYATWLFSKPVAPPAPVVQNNGWMKNPVDAFILSKLEAQHLPPAPAAGKRALIRRVYFDLIGLPPTPQEVDDFSSSADPEAYGKLVDRLLADPRYGERWGRHWLDRPR